MTYKAVYEPDHERKDDLDCSGISWPLPEIATLNDSILDSSSRAEIQTMSR